MRRIAAVFTAVLVLMLAAGALVWWKFFTGGTQNFASDRDRFTYGSLGAEAVAGIPYPVFMILPRIFPDLVAQYATAGYGPDKAAYGGYGAFGMAWEEGQRLPAGLSIKRLGYERVTLNCAICHTASYRLTADEPPHFAVGGPAHTLNLQGLLRFLIAASHDRRFTAARLLPEIALHFPLDAIDQANYALVLIPATRAALHLAEHELGWMNDKPAWGPGRDDAFNLPKFILTQRPWDKSVGNTDFPAIWRLGNRKGQLLHSAGEAKSLYAVVATSAIGIGSLPHAGFEERNEWLEILYRQARTAALPEADRPGPKRPGQGDLRGTLRDVPRRRRRPHRHGNPARRDRHRPRARSRLAATRRRSDERRHLGTGRAARRGRGRAGAMSRGRWSASGCSGRICIMARCRPCLICCHRRSSGQRCSTAAMMSSMPNVGFISTGAAAEANGFRFDTSLRGNGNGGHVYGTDLSEPDKAALIEFLKDAIGKGSGR